MTSMPPPWDPDEGETEETRILPEEETRVAPPPPPARSETPEPTRVRGRVVVDEEGPPPGAPRRGPRELWPWLLLLLGLVLALLAALWWFSRDDGGGEPELRAVPDVVGLEVAEARERLAAEGFVVEALRRASDEAPAETVFAQDPAAGTELEEGGTVRISVSVGPATTTVPSVVGLSQDDATERLRQAELEANVARVPSSEPEGVVVAQAPAAGEDVERGSSVRINVSGGPGAVTVPDVVGSPADEAVAALEQAGLRAEQTEAESDEPQGTVVEQDPAAGAEVGRGSTVQLGVSTGPQATPVPDVTGLAQEDAVAELEGEGFRVRVVEEAAPDPAQVGTVLRQVPTGGREAPPGAQVTIVVGV